MKKFIALMISAVIILSGINACAIEYSPEEDFVITKDGAVDYDGSDEIVIIPPTVKGQKVVALCDKAFYNNKYVTKIVVPDTVTRIGEYAFAYCQNLKELELPMNLEYVGEGAIYLSGIQNDYSATEEEGYLQLGSCIFASYYDTSTSSDLIWEETKVNIDNSVTVIADGAFERYKRMSFTLPKTIKYIGRNAFANKLITSNRIIDNVAYEGKYALYSQVEMKSSNGAYTYASENVEIKPGTEIIPPYFFENNKYIKTVKIPESVTEIPKGMFYSSKLEKISWHEEIEEIGEYAFYATNVEEIILPAKLKKIGENAFTSSKLKSIVIFDEVEEIGTYAFRFNNNLTDIYYTGTEEQWQELIKKNLGLYDVVKIHYNYNPALNAPAVLPENINSVTLIGGGTAVGRFFVRDTRGVPARNCGVKYTVDGKDAKYAFTDDEGYIEVQVDGITESKDFEIEITSFVTTPVKEILSVTVKPATFKSSYEAVFKKGAGLGLSGGVGATLGPVEFKASMVEIGAEGSTASGLTFQQEYKDGKSKVSLTTKIGAEVAANAKFGLFADANLKKSTTLSASLGEIGGKGGVGASAGATITIEDFDINDDADKNAIAEALLASILEATGSNVISRELIGKLNIAVESYEVGTSVSLDGNASLGLFGISQEGDIADADVTLYGVNGKAVWDSNTKFLADGNTEYESSFTKGSGNKVLEFELKTKGDSQFKGGSAFKATEKAANDVKITALHNENTHLQELSFTAKESEDEGVLWGVETNETAYTVKYPFENASGVSALNTYLSSFSRGRHPLLNTDQWQEVADVMLNNPARGEYSTSVATKKGIDIDLGIGAEAGIKIGGSIGVSGVETLKYDVETGFIQDGDIYIQGYNNIHYDLKNRIKIEDIAEDAVDIMARLVEALLDTAVEVVEEKVEHIKAILEPIGDSLKGKTVSISTPKESLTAKNILLLSAEEDEFSTSSAVTTVGNPYIIETEEDFQAKLTIAYSDEELSGADEGVLSIVRWDDEKCVYVKVDSTVDAENNKVSAIITKSGQYIISADTQPPAITQLYVNGNNSSEPEIFAVVADVSGIADFCLKLNEEIVIDINNLKDCYDYSTGIFRYSLKNYEEGYYFAEIYAKDTLGNEITECADVNVDKYFVQPEGVIAPDKIVNGCEFKIKSDYAYKLFLCAEATDKNGKKYSVSLPVQETEEGYVAYLEGIPAGLTADVWAETYTQSGNCGKTEKIQVEMAPVEIVIDEVLKGCVIVQCTNPSGLENTGKIYATVYDKDGVMIGMQTTDAVDEIMFTKLPNGATVKAFLWDGVKPLCENAVVYEE